MTIRIATLFARHGAAKYPDALDHLEEFYRQRLPGARRELVVIDNALPSAGCEPLGPGRTLIGGSNGAWEFSAWDGGIAFLAERLASFDLVHLVTSAFNQLHTRYIDRFDLPMLEALRGTAAAVGHIDRFNDPVELLGRHSQSWLRTSFLFLPPAEIRLLGRLASLPDGAAFFSGEPAHPFRPDAPLSVSFQANILGWLTGEGTGQGIAWHSRFDLSLATLPIFEAKSLAMLNEHALTLRLRAQGCAIVDATWLAARLARHDRPWRPVGGIPHWRVQLAQRDVDAVPFEPDA